ncbi:MAG: PD40 domain-containing protein [Anaerolineae bacterium]|nr:PD40 domain-containing protein [Anaerolineae bacterium]
MKNRGILKSIINWLLIPGTANVPPIVWLLLMAAVMVVMRPQDGEPQIRELERIVVLTPTPAPTSAPAGPAETPTPVGSGGTLAFAMRHNGNSDIYLLSQNNGELLRLTFDPDDDRDPAWSPDGRYLAFASQRARGWDLYTMDMVSGTILRVTHDPWFEGAPTWSSDGRWLAYESYQDGNLDIHILNLESGESHQVTHDTAPDYSPAWSPNGRHIAYVSYRDGNKDLFVLSLDDGTVTNLTNTPDQNEDYPSWSPTGEYLAYSAGVTSGETMWRIPFDLEAASRGELRPVLFGVGGKPTWSPDGTALAFVFRQEATSYLIAADTRGWALAQEGYSSADRIDRPSWHGGSLSDDIVADLSARAAEEEPPLYTELLLSTDLDQYRLVGLPDVNDSDSAEKLSDRVNDSYNALRQRIRSETGWDYLSVLGDSWRTMNHTPRPGQGRVSWHVCGRAVDINQSFLRDGRIELVREDVGGVTYWRIYIKAAVQDGSLGEPLRVAPWDLNARTKGGAATANGGELKATIPEGYFVDFTTLAMDYGWERRNALSNWRASYFDIEWWHFQKTEGMSWYDCMLELYTEDEVLASYGYLPWWTKRPEWEVQQLP